MEIGQKLRQARLATGLTQEGVAERVGVSRQTVSNWENNRSYPDIASLLALSDLYSLTLDELLKGDVAMIRHLEQSTDGSGAGNGCPGCWWCSPICCSGPCPSWYSGWGSSRRPCFTPWPPSIWCSP